MEHLNRSNPYYQNALSIQTTEEQKTNESTTQVETYNVHDTQQPNQELISTRTLRQTTTDALSVQFHPPHATLIPSDNLGLSDYLAYRYNETELEKVNKTIETIIEISKVIIVKMLGEQCHFCTEGSYVHGHQLSFLTNLADASGQVRDNPTTSLIMASELLIDAHAHFQSYTYVVIKLFTKALIGLDLFQFVLQISKVAEATPNLKKLLNFYTVLALTGMKQYDSSISILESEYQAQNFVHVNIGCTPTSVRIMLKYGCALANALYWNKNYKKCLSMLNDLIRINWLDWGHIDLHEQRNNYLTIINLFGNLKWRKCNDVKHFDIPENHSENKTELPEAIIFELRKYKYQYQDFWPTHILGAVKRYFYPTFEYRSGLVKTKNINYSPCMSSDFLYYTNKIRHGNYQGVFNFANKVIKEHSPKSCYYERAVLMLAQYHYHYKNSASDALKCIKENPCHKSNELILIQAKSRQRCGYIAEALEDFKYIFVTSETPEIISTALLYSNCLIQTGCFTGDLRYHKFAIWVMKLLRPFFNAENEQKPCDNQIVEKKIDQILKLIYIQQQR